jgi:hypothetical protein
VVAMMDSLDEKVRRARPPIGPPVPKAGGMPSPALTSAVGQSATARAPNPPGLNSAPVGRPPGMTAIAPLDPPALAPAPAAAPPPAPAPPAAASSEQETRRSSTGPVFAPSPEGASSISSLIQQALMGGLSGEGPYSKAILQSMDDEVFAKMRSGVDQANASTRGALARSGMLRSTLPAEAASRAESAGLQEFTRGIGENRRRAAEGNAAHLDSILGKAMGWQQSQDEMNLQREMASRGNRGPEMIQLQNPDGTITEIPVSILEAITSLE